MQNLVQRSEPSASIRVFRGMNGVHGLFSRLFRLALIVAALLQAAGCASLISNAASNFADNLGAAVANQNDPQTVKDGAPAYLLLLDSLIEGNPDDPAMLAAAAMRRAWPDRSRWRMRWRS